MILEPWLDLLEFIERLWTKSCEFIDLSHEVCHWNHMALINGPKSSWSSWALSLCRSVESFLLAMTFILHPTHCLHCQIDQMPSRVHQCSSSTGAPPGRQRSDIRYILLREEPFLGLWPPLLASVWKSENLKLDHNFHLKEDGRLSHEEATRTAQRWS